MKKYKFILYFFLLTNEKKMYKIDIAVVNIAL